jgi:hypothetical protein
MYYNAFCLDCLLTNLSIFVNPTLLLTSVESADGSVCYPYVHSDLFFHCCVVPHFALPKWRVTRYHFPCLVYPLMFADKPFKKSIQLLPSYF